MSSLEGYAGQGHYKSLIVHHLSHYHGGKAYFFFRAPFTTASQPAPGILTNTSSLAVEVVVRAALTFPTHRGAITINLSPLPVAGYDSVCGAVPLTRALPPRRRGGGWFDRVAAAFARLDTLRQSLMSSTNCRTYIKLQSASSLASLSPVSVSPASPV